jgi:hypothetical protein
MLALPILRQGRPYVSVDTSAVRDHRSGAVLAMVSQANPGLIRRDLRPEQQARMSAALRALSVGDLLALCARAASYLVDDELPLGDAGQSYRDYVHQTCASTGLPHVMVRRNLEKIRGVLAGAGDVLSGLARGLDLALLDHGRGVVAGRPIAYVPRGHTLGVVLPNNSPGVHALWAPALALKTALVLKPGSAEPWTPYRMLQALLRAGAPPEAFGYYPCDHAGAGELLRACGRGMFFGDASAAARYAHDARIELHGPGYSKVLLGPDQADAWRTHLDVMAASILDNAGRSCINASGVWVTAHGAAIADALAQRLAAVQPLPAEDEQAQLAPFVDGRVAERISALVDQGLAEGGAEDVTARYRRGPRLVRFEGATYLLPTIVRCAPEHPLANREFLFPFASVVEAPAETFPAALGPTLALTALTADPALLARLSVSTDVQRLNLGALPTSRVAWDQPHEGNLFEHLWARRALQHAPASTP